jgi:hypothetical protein
MWWEFLILMIAGAAGYHLSKHLSKDKQYPNWQKTSLSVSVGFLFFITALIIIIPKQADTSEVAKTAELPVKAEVKNDEPVVVAQPTHNYSLKDGFEYGYEQALSENAEDAGQIATTLVMFKYAGKQDGKHQVYSKTNEYLTTVIECAEPCEFIKISQYIKGNGLSNTERMRAVPGSVGFGVIEDAINGQLEQYVGEKEGKKFTIWFGDKKPIFNYF